MYRNWPLIYQCRTESQCSGCSDPRFRSWYSSAASGPKDVILILDTSGSMSAANRLSKMKVAAQWVLNTLTEHDYANVVTFSSVARAYSSGLVNMGVVERKKMKDYIGDLNANGGTNMAAGFRKAFELADSSWQAKKTSGCGGARMILFLTDGQNSGDEDPGTVIRNMNKELNMRIFTYSLGSGAGGDSAKMMKDIACQNQGVWTAIPDSATNLKEIMAGYFVYLAAGISNAPPRWSDWFEDGQGLGQIAGACQAVFDRTSGKAEGVNVLFGVICQSIHKSTWDKFSDAATVWGEMSTQNKKCADLSLSSGQLEILRGQISSSSVCANSIGLNAGSGISQSAVSLAVAVLVATIAASQF